MFKNRLKNSHECAFPGGGGGGGGGGGSNFID